MSVCLSVCGECVLLRVSPGIPVWVVVLRVVRFGLSVCWFWMTVGGVGRAGDFVLVVRVSFRVGVAVFVGEGAGVGGLFCSVLCGVSSSGGLCVGCCACFVDGSS